MTIDTLPHAPACWQVSYCLPPEPAPPLALPPYNPVLLPEPSPATIRAIGLQSFLDDLAAELAKRPGVKYESQYIPHAGHFSIRLPAAGRNVWVAQQRDDQLTFGPAPGYNADRKLNDKPAWTKTYTVPYSHPKTLAAINNVINRHNFNFAKADGKQYTNKQLDTCSQSVFMHTSEESGMPTKNPGPLSAPPARRGEVIEQSPSFEYLPDLTPDTAAQLFQRTQAIKRHQTTAIKAIIEFGQELIAVKQLLDHGQFGLWLDAEFAMSERTAQHMISVAARFADKSATVADLPINIGALYELAAPSTPDPVVDQVIDRAQSGETITRAAVKAAKTPTVKDELPAESLEDLIFAALENGASTMVEIMAAVKKAGGAWDANTLGRMVVNKDIIRNAPPGERITYSLNGHTETGSGAPSVATAKEMLIDLVASRPRDTYYLNQLSRWSGINDRKRTQEALAAFTDPLLIEDTDAAGRTIYRRPAAEIAPATTDPDPRAFGGFVDASLPTGDEIVAAIDANGGIMQMTELAQQFDIEFNQVWDLLAQLDKDGRTARGNSVVYTAKHPKFNNPYPGGVDLTAAPADAHDGTPDPAPVSDDDQPDQQVIIPGQEALNAELAGYALGDLADLLLACENAMLAVQSANLRNLRHMTRKQQQMLDQRMTQFYETYQATERHISAQAVATARTSNPDGDDYAAALKSGNMAAASAIGDAAALEAAQGHAPTSAAHIPARRFAQLSEPAK